MTDNIVRLADYRKDKAPDFDVFDFSVFDGLVKGDYVINTTNVTFPQDPGMAGRTVGRITPSYKDMDFELAYESLLSENAHLKQLLVEVEEENYQLKEILKEK